MEGQLPQYHLTTHFARSPPPAKPMPILETSSHIYGLDSTKYGFGSCLARVPFIPMPYFNEAALLPLPRSYRIYQHGLTLTLEEIVIPHGDDDEEQALPPTPDE